MLQTPSSIQARLAFWVRPELADDFNAQITHTLAPILKKLGFTRSAPTPRREALGVCSRLLTLSHSYEIDTAQRQLAADPDWVAQIKELSATYAPDPNEDISYRITPFKITSPTPQIRRTGAGYHEGTWHTFGVRDGLPSSLIKQVLQNQEGNLWLCTHENGICYFDGRHFSAFTQQTGLPSNSVHFFLIDRTGNLWCATDKGICRYDGQALETFTSEDGLAEDPTLMIREGRQGRIWFLSAGGRLSFFDGEQFAAIETDIAIAHINEDREGRLWCTSLAGKIYRYDGNTFVFIGPDCGLPTERIKSTIIDQAGSIWCATSTAIYRCDDVHFIHVASVDQPAEQPIHLFLTCVRWRAMVRHHRHYRTL